jgi:hypothetical protein
VHSVFFVLFGAIIVKFTDKRFPLDSQSVTDVVRGGNVLGEEAFF